MSSLVGIARLTTEVVRKNLCVLCGACEVTCPISIVKIDKKPILKGACLFCDICTVSCPRTEDVNEIIKTRFLNPVFKSKEIGSYIKVYSARTNLNYLKDKVQDGGIVSTLIIYLLENKVVDGAILTVADSSWNPRPIVARDKEDVIKAAGTKYASSPVLNALNHAVSLRLKRLAIVGTPCQITAVRKMQLYPSISGFGDYVFITIGLFCMESFDYDTFKKYVEDKGVKIEDVRKFAITKGRFIAVSKSNDELINVPIDEMKDIARSACHYCTDFSAELADISIGSVGSEGGWSTVITRSNKGEKVFGEAVAKGYITSKPIEQAKPGLKLVKRLSRKKRESAKKI
jgi:coenzyme F420 hydrogenase subunit beta